MRTRPGTSRPTPSRRLVRSAAVALAVLAAARPGRAEVPAEQALALLGHLDPRHPEQSPFRGLAALKSGILANVRFFGNYGASPDERFPPHPGLQGEGNCPQDAIAAVVEYLFPSPDGVILTPNERGQDPIGDIAQEAAAARRKAQKARDKQAGREHKAAHAVRMVEEGKGLWKIRALLEAVAGYRRQLAGAGGAGDAKVESKAAAAGPEQAALAFRDLAGRILDPGGRGRAAGGETKADPFRRVMEPLPGLLERAVALESTPEGDRAYPPDIVEAALLAYAWKVADQVTELLEAFAGAQLVRPEGKADLPLFDHAYYAKHLDDFRRRLEARKGPGPVPAEYALFLYGYRAYQSPLPDLASYRTTTYLGKATYPDCGETSLRNFFIIAFAHEGRIDQDRVRRFLAKVAARMARAGEEAKDGAVPGYPGQLEAIEGFFRHFDTVASQFSTEAHAAWSAIVSNRNEGEEDPLRIEYRNGRDPAHPDQPGTHNLMGLGVRNLLNLVAHLLPDPELARPWPGTPEGDAAVARAKLDHLCQLASSEGRTWDWKVQGTGGLLDPRVSLAFGWQDAYYFTWEFMPGHYVIQPIALPDNQCWFRRVSWAPGDFWLTGWRTRLMGKDLAVTLACPADVYRYDLGDADQAVYLLDTMLATDSTAYLPTYLQVARRLPCDTYAIRILTRMLYEHEGNASFPDFYPLAPFKDASRREDLGQVLAAGVTANRPAEVRFALDHGADPNQATPGGGSLLAACSLLGSDSVEIMERLVKAGADLRTRDGFGRTPLHMAADAGNLGMVALLLEKGADPLATDRTGRTPLDTANFWGRKAIVEVLEKALKAREEKQQPSGRGPGGEAGTAGPAAAGEESKGGTAPAAP